MIYLDYQATTPLAPEARAAMLPWLEGKFGNPHSPHRMGREAAAAVEAARARVLRALVEDGAPGSEPVAEDVALRAGGAWPDAPSLGPVPEGRLLFTGGATEALNWAIKGCWQVRPAGRDRVVTIATEHSAVLDTVHALAGVEAVVLPVDHMGRVDMDALRAALDDRTALVAAMLVNNEIGVIHDIAAIGALARAAGAVMLCDAVQGFGRVRVPVAACDLIAISAHKIHGPKGIGALWLRDGVEPAPLMHGGGQEGGIRSGTLSPMLCAGFGAAAEVARVRRGEDIGYIFGLYERLRAGLGQEWHVNGDRNMRWRGNLNIRRDGVDAARLISELRGIAFSAGSACASGTGKPSRILTALGLSDAQARGSIRLGFGRYTTEAEVDAAAEQINAAAERQRIGFAA